MFEEENDEPFYEAEDCEYCLKTDEENDIMYESNFTWRNDCWERDSCGSVQ